MGLREHSDSVAFVNAVSTVLFERGDFSMIDFNIITLINRVYLDLKLRVHNSKLAIQINRLVTGLISSPSLAIQSTFPVE